MKYTLLKLDVLDPLTYPDVYYEAYQATDPTENLEHLLSQAITQFYELNSFTKSFESWLKNASDGTFDFQIRDENSHILFVASKVLLISDKVLNALRLAMKYHYGQIRKGDSYTPYIRHILEITSLLLRYHNDEVLIASAFCHDLLEDSNCSEQEIEEQCGKEVLRIVQAVSTDSELEENENWEKKKSNYIKCVKEGGIQAMTVCLADKIVNLYSLQRVLKLEGDKVWSRFNRGKDKKHWFESECLKMLKENLEHPLIEVYEGLINEIYS